MLNKKTLNHSVILILGMIACGFLSVFFGKELCWDLAHYHYYVSFAFLNNREQFDFWPSSYLHQYINPTIDLLSYFLINQFTSRMAEFALGAIHGINLWLLFLIASYFIQGKFKISLSLLLAILGLYGPTTLSGIGSFQNDNLITLFVLGFVVLQLKTYTLYQTNHQLAHKFIFFSGFLLGLGFGLKLTAGIFVVGGLLSISILPIPVRHRMQYLFLIGLAILIGMLTTSGHWMYTMWQRHHNPFFPFFNGLFHSPDFFPIDWRDTRFLPKTLLQQLFFPFYFSWDGRTADAPFQDFRFLFVYLLYVLVALHWAWKRWNHSSQKIPLTLFWLNAFFIFSYFVWQYYFSIARYLATLEMLCPLVIYLLIRELFTDFYSRLASCTIIFYLLFLFLSPIPMVRAPWYDNTFFNVKLPNLVSQTDQATVLITYTAFVMDRDPRPQSYLIPFFPSQWKFIGVPFWGEKYLADKKLTEEIRSKLLADKNPVYLLTADDAILELYRAANQFGLQPKGPCERITSDRQAITHQQVLLCPVTQISSLGVAIAEPRVK